MAALLKTTIAEIVAANDEAAHLFALLGIDYACHGNLTLPEACAEAGLDLLKVKRSAEQLSQTSEKSWLDQPVKALISHLREVKNPALLRTVSDAGAVLHARCGPCASFEDEVDRIAECYGRICGVLRQHLSREEHVLLPVVEHLDDCWSRGQKPSMRLAGGVRPAMATLIGDHQKLAVLLGEIREVATQLAARHENCADLLQVLHELDHAVRDHIHVQNNILFPRAAALECVVEEPVRSRLSLRHSNR